MIMIIELFSDTKVLQYVSYNTLKMNSVALPVCSRFSSISTVKQACPSNRYVEEMRKDACTLLPE